MPTVSHNNLNMNTDQWLYYNCMAAAVIMTAMAWSLTRSRFGRAFIALRDSEIGAQQMGINVSLYKMTAFGLSSLYAGAGGALYVYQASYLGPTSFDILFSLTLLVMIVLGGLASITGTIFAALILTFRVDITNFVADHIPFGDEDRHRQPPRRRLRTPPHRVDHLHSARRRREHREAESRRTPVASSQAAAEPCRDRTPPQERG